MRFKKLWKVSIYDRNTKKIVFQTMPTYSWAEQEKQLIDNSCVVHIYGQSRKQFIEFYDTNKIAVIERIKGAVIAYLEMDYEENH